MSSNRQAGFVSFTVLALILVSVALAGAIGFGVWAYMGRQDYKHNSDQKAAAAADAATRATQEADAIKYAEEAKNPLKTHKAPDAFGGVSIIYPKTWSAYVVENLKSGVAVNDYFHPDFVPDTDNRDNAYALRVQVVNQSYDRVLSSYDSEIENGQLKASAYTLPKVSEVIGTRLDGQIEESKQGSLVILPVRNMTLKVWTESNDFLKDFNNIILPNLTFAP